MVHGSIVLVGDFFPAEFHPSWFERHKIFPIQETEWAIGRMAEEEVLKASDGTEVVIVKAPEMVVNNNVAQLNFKKLKVIVEREKLIVSAQKEVDFPELREVVHKLLLVLRSSKFRAIGFNFDLQRQYPQTASDVIKEFFVADEKIFSRTFAPNAVMNNQVLFADNEARIRVNFQCTSPNSIVADSNFHRDLSNGSETAIGFLDKYFESDLQKFKKIVGSALK